DTAPAARTIHAVRAAVGDPARTETRTLQVHDHDLGAARKPAMCADRLVDGDRAVRAGQIPAGVGIARFAESRGVAIVHADPEHPGQDELDEELGKHGRSIVPGGRSPCKPKKRIRIIRLREWGSGTAPDRGKDVAWRASTWWRFRVTVPGRRS